MKKNVLMLAGVLSCAMMIFSVQADDASTQSGDLDKERHHHHHHHHHHTTVNVTPPVNVNVPKKPYNDKAGCFIDDGGLCCPGEPCYGNKDK